MTEVSIDSRGFAVRNRRVQVVGARMEYALVDPADWLGRLQSLRAAGFNTVVTSVPWSAHERRRGLPEFEGQADVARFIGAAAEAGLWVILRVGPNVGAPYGGGGLPPWLADLEDESGRMPLQREADPAFLEAVTDWWSALFERIRDLQPATEGDGPEAGPLLAAQVEHEWACGNEDGGRAYFGELIHRLRELGLTVPLLTTNGFWQELEGTTECWVDHVDEPELFANARQLHVVQPDAPRLVHLRGGADHPGRLGRAMQEILAAGAMPIVDDAVAGVHRRTFPGTDSPTSVVPGSVLDHHGRRVEASADVSRVARFARGFGSLLAGLDPALDLPVVRPGSEAHVLVPRSGTAGGLLHLLPGSGRSRDVEQHLLTREGRSLNTHALGSGSWCLTETNLGGRGRLDRANVPLLDLVGGRILVAFGSPSTTARFAIDGSELEMQVPATGAARPEVAEFRNFLVVLCTPAMADTVVDDGSSVWVWADHVDDEGRPVAGIRGRSLVRIDPEGGIETVGTATRSRSRRPAAGLDWSRVILDQDVDGSSDRFATLNGPASLVECGIRSGYGWYRIDLATRTAGRRTLRFPEGPHRLVIFLNGRQVAELDHREGSAFTTTLNLPKGDNVMTVLAELTGGAHDGNSQVLRSGIHSAIETLAPLKDVATAVDRDVPPIDPFESRSFIPEASHGDRSSNVAHSWTFTHRRRTPLRFTHESGIRGTWFLNDRLIGRSEESGLRSFRLCRDSVEGMKQGRNVLVFRPDSGMEKTAAAVLRSSKLHEITEEHGLEDGTIAFSTCAAPDGLIHRFVPLSGRRKKGPPSKVPAWSRAAVGSGQVRATTNLDLSGMSRGVVYINGRPIGAYHAENTPLLPVPTGLPDEEFTIDVFDELGADPRGIALA